MALHGYLILSCSQRELEQLSPSEKDLPRMQNSSYNLHAKFACIFDSNYFLTVGAYESHNRYGLFNSECHRRY